MIPALAAIDPPNARNVALRVDRSAERALRSGHPWLFESGVRQQSHRSKAGDLAVVFDRHRKFLAIGLYDPDSPIRVRVLHYGKPVPLDAEFFGRRFAELAAKRRHLLQHDTNGHRLVNGENESMPGLVVDRYAKTLVVKLYTPAWIPHLPVVIPELLRVTSSQRIVLRLSRDTMRREQGLFELGDGQVLFGPPLDRPLVFRENGLSFECDPVAGQKTGFFLDQRENRSRVERLAQHKEVLNVFAYTGGFSVYVARGGARNVVSLDQSKPALAAAERNFTLNQEIQAVARARHETVAGHAFATLSAMRSESRSFDLVIIDPPSFAPQKSAVDKARVSYAKLVKLGLSVLRSGGHFVMASCSSRISSAEFFDLVHQTASHTGRPLHELERTGHPSDHPIGFPQGAYLKCLFAVAP